MWLQHGIWSITFFFPMSHKNGKCHWLNNKAKCDIYWWLTISRSKISWLRMIEKDDWCWEYLIYKHLHIYQWGHTLFEEECEGKGAVVWREEQSSNRSVCQPIYYTINRLIKQATNQSISPCISNNKIKPIYKLINQPINHLLKSDVEIIYWDQSTVDIICWSNCWYYLSSWCVGVLTVVNAALRATYLATSGRGAREWGAPKSKRGSFVGAIAEVDDQSCESAHPHTPGCHP